MTIGRTKTRSTAGPFPSLSIINYQLSFEPAMKSIGLAPNPLREESLALATRVAGWLSERSVRAVVTCEAAERIGRPDLAATEEEVVETDLLLILGGDGTMLRWSRLAAPKGTPMMGVNFGQYGFITEVHPDETIDALALVLDGKYYISERTVLKATLTRSGSQIGAYFALNDVVVSKGPLSRMLGLRILVSGKFIVTYAADGIIVSSPTGSTAYSLSAGGPVVHPDVGVFIITPICPHTLNARSLVIPDKEQVRIIGECDEGPSHTMLTVDGQLGEHLQNEDEVEIVRADYMARLVHLEPQSFYTKLQTRMRWGERLSGPKGRES